MLSKFISYVCVTKNLSLEPFDGKEFWQKFKKFLANYNDKINVMFSRQFVANIFYEFFECRVPENFTETDLMKILALKGIDEKDCKFHFFVQLFRIPLLEPTGIQKLFQIALNIAQLETCLLNMPEKFSTTYYDENMFVISNYISSVSCSRQEIVDKFLCEFAQLMT